MTTNEYIRFKCIEVSQPVGTFYIGSIDSQDLVKIAYADILRIEQRDVEKYLGVERPLSDDRVKEISNYVNTIDATFPTSIILAISSEEIVEYDKGKGIMKIKREENVAKIIDGQHRIAGLKAYSGNKFVLNVTIFVDIDLEDQGMVFATINLAQTKVSKSIAYALYEYARSRSPYKTCHNIAKLLNSKEGSPFKDKIKILGRATPGKYGETLTQAAFVDRLLPLISKDPMLDRDILKRGKKLDRVSINEERANIFINMFREERDAEIARIIWNYFSAVEYKWEKAWKEARSGNILNRTAGFTALMNFLPRTYLSFGKLGEIISIEDFASVFVKMTLRGDDFNPERYVPGAKGERKLFLDLCKQSGLNL